MRLRTVAGAYAGQIRDYSTAVGFAALRSGTAALIDEPTDPVRTVPVAARAASGQAPETKKVHARRPR